MPNIHETPGALAALQDDIYRDKILRARAMTMEQRFTEGLALTNEVFQRMLEGAMWQLEIEDEERGWAEVRRRLERLSAAQDYRFFVTERPESA